MHVPFAREVLAITSTRRDDRASPSLDHVHEVLQMPLNHLGIVVREHDLRDGPPDFDPRRTRAVLTWLHDDAEAPEWLWPTLERAHAARLRIVHFGGFGPLARDPERLRGWLRRLGMVDDGPGSVDPLEIEVDFCGTAPFESRPLLGRVHAGPRNTSPANRPWLATTLSTSLAPPRHPVITGPWGGIALQPWAIRLGTGVGDRRWLIDPFAFFRAALGLTDAPAPDPNVVCGRRRFILHIDGDGFESPSTARHGELSARVMLEEVLDRFRLPTTVSVIIASLTDDYTVDPPTPEMELAREILARPYVEVASHAVLHPLHWRRRHTTGSAPHTVVWYDHLAHYDHSMVAEVRDSIRFINERLCAPEKRCQVMLWSGQANPTEEVVAACAEVGCVNLNGGVYRFDALHHSVGYVAPWGKQVGAEFQVYCGAANENVFEGFFDTMPGSFEHINQTLENTGTPRILKPANLYIHFYSAERPARLAALLRLITRWSQDEETVPCLASAYARAVRAAQERVRLQRVPGGWEVAGAGDCPTLRFDHTNRQVDWARSVGVVGARRIGESFYVHLSGATARIIWAAPDAAPRPHLEQTDHAVRDVVLTEDGITLLSESRGSRHLIIAGLPPASELEVSIDGLALPRQADRAGRVALKLTPQSGERVQVRVR
ncbi:MAG: hypothetical protein AAF628_08545 [Planctomycetota bacterium]